MVRERIQRRVEAAPWRLAPVAGAFPAHLDTPDLWDGRELLRELENRSRRGRLGRLRADRLAPDDSRSQAFDFNKYFY